MGPRYLEIDGKLADEIEGVASNVGLRSFPEFVTKAVGLALTIYNVSKGGGYRLYLTNESKGERVNIKTSIIQEPKSES